MLRSSTPRALCPPALIVLGLFWTGCQPDDSDPHHDAGPSIDDGGPGPADAGSRATDANASADAGSSRLPCDGRMCDPATEFCVIGTRFGPGTVETQSLCVTRGDCGGCRCAVDAAPVAWFNAYDEQLMCNLIRCDDDGESIVLDCDREPER